MSTTAAGDRRPVPDATYRLQLHAGYTFDDAAALVPYLAELGVSHVYCSPVLQATPGSTHGYDVVDHGRLSDELGGSEGFARLSDTARRHGLGLVVDLVPNHMAVPEPESLNAALWATLSGGRDAAYARWFDVDWDAEDGRILLPVLGRDPQQCAADGELQVIAAPDGPRLRYFDHEFPVPPATPQGAATPQLLDALPYRLASWRTANDRLNYRRFFDVTSLIAVRVEEPEVFEATHRLVLALVARGAVDGLRIDHPDGLADPGGYLRRLRERTGGRWVVVEKILELEERLPASWACAGTTGYDALNHLMGVLTDPAGEAALTAVYRDVSGMQEDYPSVAATAKRFVVERVLVAEVNRLDRTAAAAGAPGLREALVEVLAAFPVYRAYVRDDPPAARAHLDTACTAAVERRPDLRQQVEQVRSLALSTGDGTDAPGFATRFGQTTGPVLAKGVEDTAFYRYVRLSALNEVGGDPGRFGVAPEAFHDWCARIHRDWPATMTTLSTHDTKRSEDLRARLLVLAEQPRQWAQAVQRWRAAAAGHRRPAGPDGNDEYLFWQTLVGAWPVDARRLGAYMEKATREAKRRTSWTDPDPAYDEAVQDFVRGVCSDAALLADVERYVAGIVVAGRVNSLSQKLLQLTLPGVPDVYQGCELWSLALVDPDNRRPVDYDLRRRMLARDGEALPRLDEDREGRSKLRVVTRALRCRRERPEAFGAGAHYRPLVASGEAATHLVGFLRGDTVAAVATRLPAGLAERGGWGDTVVELPPGLWRDALTGRPQPAGSRPVADLLAELPVALLERAA